jgi:apolipoprotein N-acyltransferase
MHGDDATPSHPAQVRIPTFAETEREQYYSAVKRTANIWSNRVWAIAYLAAAAFAAYLAFLSPIRIDGPTIGDYFYLSVVALHLVWGGALFLSARRLSLETHALLPRSAEVLFAYSFLLFWVLYAFALNANMDYVQRFVESGGELNFAPDTATERLLVAVRFAPFLAVNLMYYLATRLKRPQRVDQALRPRNAALAEPMWRRGVRRWALLPVLASAALSGFALPSFLSADGIWILGWIAMVPLFLVFSVTGYWGGVFYGIVFGLFRTVLTNYWLATYSLISLQFAVAVFLVFYGLFLPVLMFFYHGMPRFRLLILPLGWTVFEFLRSSGFLGYPWALQGHSQYTLVPLVQFASITGVWGVSFLVILVNAVLAQLLLRRMDGWRAPWAILGGTAVALALLSYGGAMSMAFGSAHSASSAEETEPEQVRMALIQQNSDPRKHEYSRTLRTLQELTDAALREDPDIVLWSETAFVPNIRRWGAEDPPRSRYARLVHRFLDYQESIDTWLLTGNDDYEVVRDEEGTEVDRLNYNAAVLFDDQGRRMDTYRKIKLVPFTEYFPYRETLPWVYELLLEFDTSFWEPGEERTVFQHPDVAFATPICFEDVFPNEVRKFVRAGAEVIANISNDYWSLTPVQAKQHFVAGLFRAVENRRPMVRSTASGVTAHVDRFGRIKATVPTYSEEHLVVDVTIPPDRFTLYTRWGDWFPISAAILLVLGALFEVSRSLLIRRR